jgi:hypothetical protein
MAFFIAAAALAVGSAAAGAIGGSSKRKAARAREQINVITRIQQRRAFLNKFRQAQASVLVSGVASGAGIESSAVRGQQASNITQRGVALTENIEQEELQKTAAKASERAAKFDIASDALSTGASLFLAGSSG